jgi:hypothetical protein
MQQQPFSAKYNRWEKIDFLWLVGDLVCCLKNLWGGANSVHVVIP